MEKILLWEKTPEFNPDFGQEEPCLIPKIIPGAKICVLVLPGGAYEWRAEDHEGHAIADRLNRDGISTFILRYRYAPYRHPVEQMDVNRAVRMVRSLAGTYGYDPHRIAVLGFSAGGHLAATAVTRFDEGREDGDAIDKISCRPDAGILCYPVIDLAGKFAHKGSAVNLIGSPDSSRYPTLATELSCQNGVTDRTPPCFLWHTAADGCVPVENTLMMAAALSAKKIPFEVHIFPKGDHGLGLATETLPYVSVWMELAQRFLHLYLGE